MNRNVVIFSSLLFLLPLTSFSAEQVPMAEASQTAQNIPPTGQIKADAKASEQQNLPLPQGKLPSKKNLAETKKAQEYPVKVEPFLPRMKPLGKFSAGVPNAGIYKLFDETDNIVCYVLMPNSLETKREGGGELTYNSNNIGSISCVRIDVQQPKGKSRR